MSDMPWRSLRAVSRAMLKRSADLQVEGLERIPDRGPVILAARHYHHLFDGEALVATIPRPVHLMVALDWAAQKPAKALLTAACRAARWPAVIRLDAPNAADPREARRVLRQATGDALQLLCEGRILIVFPEGYPNIDPQPGPKTGEDEFLPFKDGFARLAAMALSEGMSVPIVPTGFAYARGSRWRITLRFGEPVQLHCRADIDTVRSEVESQVIALSKPSNEQPE